MTIATKRKKDVNNTQRGSRTGGYWYRPKKFWPKATLYNVEMSNNAHSYESNMAERYLPLATGLANYYGGEFSARVQKLAAALLADIYHGPEGSLEVTLRNPDYARKCGADLFGVLNVIGNYNVFYDNGFVKEETVEASEEIAKDLYLSRKRLGMPVKSFLLYYKGEGLKREDISVLSGIPAKYVQWAYNILTAYMWEVVDGLHQRKAEEEFAQRKMPVRQAYEDPKLLVDFSGPSRHMTGEMLDDCVSDAVDPMETAPVVDEANETPEFDQVEFVADTTEQETSE